MHQLNAIQSQPNVEPAAKAVSARKISTPVMILPTGSASRRERSIGSWVLLFLVRLYIVFLSPFFGGACKFYPSCSNYAREAIERHGTLRGTLLALKRLLRCHPFTPGGIDFVPDELPSESRAPRGAHAHFAAGGQGKAQ